MGFIKCACVYVFSYVLPISPPPPLSTDVDFFKIKIMKALADTLGKLMIDIDIDIDETTNEADIDEAVTATADHMMYM